MYQGDFPEIMVPIFDIPSTLGAEEKTSRAVTRPSWSSIMPSSFFKDLFSIRHAPTSEKQSSWFTHGAENPTYKKINDVESSAASDASSSDGSSTSESSTISSKSKQSFDARVVSDAIIGLSDGLTVPFALTAGLSALGNTQVVIFGGMAELIAGAISMGLGGYLGAKSEEQSYRATVSQTRDHLANSPETVSGDISAIFEPYDLPSSTTQELIRHLSDSPRLLDFLMHFQHTLPEPASSRALTCAMTIAIGYFIGGFVPLLPYFFVAKTQVTVALWWSMGIMAMALFVFGYVKTCFVAGWKGKNKVVQGLIGGAQMVVVGSAAAGAAMGVVRAFKSWASA